MDDNILWLICELNGVRLCFYMLAPYLHEDDNNYYAKLIYSTHQCFSSGNIVKIGNSGEKWYKTIHYLDDNGVRRTVDDYQVQRLASDLGFEPADGIWSSLNIVPKRFVTEVLYPPLVSQVYGQQSNIMDLVEEIVMFYNTSTNKLKLSGSGGFFNSPVSELNDFDIIIPVDSYKQLSSINRDKIPSNALLVKQKDKVWPLRWINQFNLIVCPFFIYGDIENPVLGIKKTKDTAKGKIKITNSDYGIFNIPLYECTGEINKLMLKSSFFRGKIENMMEFSIECSIYEITDGVWKGESIGLIKDYREAARFFEMRIR